MLYVYLYSIFTYHIVNIKRNSLLLENLLLYLFTYHIVNIKLTYPKSSLAS